MLTVTLKLKKTFRKRSRQENNWKNNKRKRLRQSRQEYIDSKCTQQGARKLHFRQHCHGKCIFKCTENIGQSRQQMLFEHFWMLPDAEKAHFYAKTTTRWDKKNEHESQIRSLQFQEGTTLSNISYLLKMMLKWEFARLSTWLLLT